MKRSGVLVTALVSAGLALAGCVPAYQYEPLTLTSLDLGQSRSVSVMGIGGWRDTAIEVRRDEVYRIATQGTWSASAFCGPVDASGLAAEHLMCMKAIFANAFPIPEAKIMALVGKIGADGKPFLIGGTNGFIADRDGTLFVRSNDPDGFLWDNTGQIELAVQHYGEGVDAISFQAGSTGGVIQTNGTTTAHTPRMSGSGYYGAEQDIGFNVLETVSFDPATGELSIAGHFDPKYAGPRIPYLQHLAVFLENPGPQVSLDWTPEFKRRVDSFFRRMDNEQEMANLVSAGQLLDAEGNITKKGRLFMPVFGFKAYEHGHAAGALGAEVNLKEPGVVTITRIVPGSAAERAGLQVGNEIYMVTPPSGIPQQPLAPETLVRIVRFAGAGARVMFNVDGFGPKSEVYAILDAFPGDSWAHVTTYDLKASIFRTGGHPKIANFLVALDRMFRLKDSEAGNTAMWFLLHDLGVADWADQARLKVINGEMAKEVFMNELPRRMTQGMERMMEFPAGAMMNIYEQSFARSGNGFGAMDIAVEELNRRLAPVLKESLRTALHKNDQITLPVGVLDESANFSPQVQPRYINIPPDSELARLFIEADYVAKAIIHRPDLSERIPAYKTEYAFTGDRPGRVEETTNRLWMEPARVDVYRSSDNSTLRFGRTEMRINIGRAIGGGSERRDDGYGQFLTGLYDDLAGEFTQLHELREVAKLAIVARWLNSVKPGFRLPTEGRARLSPPATLEGFVTLIWSPQRIKVSLIAPGGIDFNVPPIGPSGPVFPDRQTVNVPIDTSVVDMRDFTVDDMPTVDPALFSPDAATSIPARYRRPLSLPPVPSSVRLVALATKGQRTLGRINGLRTQTASDAGRCDADKSRTLHDKLSDAASTARRLQGVEDALNAITSQEPERQRSFDKIDKTVREEEQRLTEGMMDIATSGLLGAYDELKGGTQVRSIQDLETLITTMRDAKAKLGDISDKLANLDLAISSAMARSLNEREQATQGLLSYIKDVLSEGATVKGTDATSRALRTAGKALNVAGKVQTALDGAESLYKIADAAETLQRLDTQSEIEIKGLRDSLLPLQRQLSDRLDAAMNDPQVRAFEAGTGRFDCGG